MSCDEDTMGYYVEDLPRLDTNFINRDKVLDFAGACVKL